MEYKIVQAHPSMRDILRILKREAVDGWSYKHPLSNMFDANDGWIGLVFERRVS